MNCPHCKKGIELSAKLAAETTITLKIQYEPGRFPDAEITAKAIENFSKLNKAVAKEIGGKVACFIKELNYSNDAVTCTLLVLEHAAKGGA